MANLLGVTNPVPGYDGASNRSLPVSPNDTQIQNVPDPSRVGRPDARTDQDDSGNLGNSDRLRYDSNFQTFLQRLRDTPSLAESLSKLLTGRMGTQVLSGIGEGTAAELAQVLEMLHMDETQLLQFLSGQLRSGTRFGGALFALLRNAHDRANSEGVRNDILQFLKCYTDYSSTSHIEGNLLRNLRGMADSVPASWAERLNELAAQLENGIAAGDRAGNLRLLQGSVIPYLSNYVERTHDMGRARALLTLMTLDLARYENGSEMNLIESFHQLNGYASLRDKLGGIDDQSLLNLLNNSEFAKASRSNHFAEHMAEAAARALRGTGSAEMQEAFRNIVAAMLVNESVYMPLNHFILPLEWDGRMLFSEFWVDPDAEQEPGKDENRRQGGRTMKFLLKMDVQELGLFDVVLTSQELRVAIKVFCPERVAPFSKLIEGAVTDILTRNGLTPEEVQVRKMGRPVTLTEVFPKIFEGKNSINVKV